MYRLALPAFAVAALVAPTVAHAQPTGDYVVQEGDSCMSIAIKVLGDRRKLPELHRMNPQLGALPHTLVAGQVIKVPAADGGPDARLTGKTGEVRFRTASEETWDDARRGMDLFRAWRVGAESRASAEVTFRDTQRLFLREHTIVIIYGPELRRARTTSPDALLERGTLRTQLAGLSGPSTLTVKTPTATAGLGRGSAIVSVLEADATSLVANHDGAAIDLRGDAGGRVAVKSGMGTRVLRGKKPERPRKLPATPAWVELGPLGFVALDGAASIEAGWYPVAGAAGYRVEVWRGAALVAAVEVPDTVTQFAVHGAPPGQYRATIAALDRDRLEGRPSAALSLEVRGVAITAPGAAWPTIPPPIGEDQPLAGADPPSRKVALGSRVVTDQLTCDVHADPGAVAILDTPGPRPLACVDELGLAYTPLALEVDPVVVSALTPDGSAVLYQGESIELGIGLTSAAALGDAWQVEPSPGLTVDGIARTRDGVRASIHADPDAPAEATLRVVDSITQRTVGTVVVAIIQARSPTAPVIEPVIDVVRPVRPPPRGPAARVTMGAYAGWLHQAIGLADGSELGDAALEDYLLDSGAAFGLRAAWWPRRRVMLEAELGVAPGHFIGAPELGWIYGGHVHLGVDALARGRFTLRGLAGGGAYAFRTDSPFAADDIDGDFYYGATVTFDLDDRIRVRLDGRHHLVPDRTDGGVTDAFELNAGLEAVLAR
jgi:hypothetical protein